MSLINEALFTKPPKEGSTLRCAVCLGILEEPMQLPCMHVFCQVCTKNLGGKCPLDRQPFSTTIPERNIKNIIEELDVCCPNSENGCTWIGEYGKFSSHSKDCGFEKVSCPNCNRLFLRKDSKEHNEKCPNNSIQCEFAVYGCTVKIPKQNPEEHPMNHPSHISLLLKQLQANQTLTSQLVSRVAKLEEKLEVISKDANSNSSKIFVSLREVTEKINEAIHGSDGRDGGARLYDRGNYEKCYQLYRNTAEMLVKRAKAAGQTDSWIKIFEKSFELCSQTQAKNWGAQVDGAWIMRRAFEAIKEAAYTAGEYEEDDFMSFWNRIKDLNGFRLME